MWPNIGKKFDYKAALGIHRHGLAGLKGIIKVVTGTVLGSSELNTSSSL
jgi:hypothetical protein